MATEWNKAVKKAFKMGRKTNKNFTLKQAMFDAKKIYKKKRGAPFTRMGKRVGDKTRRKHKKVRGGGGVDVTPFNSDAGVAKNASNV
jgi:hypothetical protein